MYIQKNADNLKPMKLQVFAIQDPDLQAKVLQLFEEGTGEEDLAPSPGAVEAPEGAVVPPAEKQPEQPAAATPGQPENPAPPAGDLTQLETEPTPQSVLEKYGLGQFKTLDDLAKSYKEIESFKGGVPKAKAQEMETLRQQNEQLAQQLQTIQEKLQNQSTIMQDPAEPNEDIFNDPEALSDLQYSDPVKFAQLLEQRAEKRIMEQLRPTLDFAQQAQQERQQAQEQFDWVNTVNAFKAQHPDLEEWQLDMGQIIKDNPSMKNAKGLEQAYLMAKGQKYPSNPGDLLTNEAFVNDHVLTNEDVKNKIIQQYLADLQAGKAPITIGSQSTGNMPLTPPVRPKNMEEAARMAFELLNK